MIPSEESLKSRPKGRPYLSSPRSVYPHSIIVLEARTPCLATDASSASFQIQALVAVVLRSYAWSSYCADPSCRRGVLLDSMCDLLHPVIVENRLEWLLFVSGET